MDYATFSTIATIILIISAAISYKKEDIFDLISNNSDVFKSLAIDIDMDDFMANLAKVKTDTDFEILCRQIGYSSDEILGFFKVKNWQKLKKKLGIEPAGLLEQLAMKFEDKPPALKYLPLAAKYKKDLSYINYSDLYTFLVLTLTIAFPSQLRELPTSSILFYWYVFKNKTEEAKELLRIIGEPYDLYQGIMKYVPSDIIDPNELNLPFIKRQQRLWQLDMQTISKIAIETVRNAIKNVYNTDIAPNSADLDKYLKDQIIPFLKTFAQEEVV